MIKTDTSDILTVLDKAIAEVAKNEMCRLRNGLSDEDVSVKIGEAFKELDKLRKPDATPDYRNKWVALFYLTWYQSRQINLFYSCLDQKVTALPARLKVFDFGCGAWAVQFALAIFAATRSQTKTNVSVHGIDPSLEMIRIGRQLWNEFGRIICQDRKFKNLCSVITAMSEESCTTYTSDANNFTLCSDKDGAFLGCERWVTSAHVVYEQMHLDLGKELRKACIRVRPTQVIVTCEEFKGEPLDSALNVMGCSFRKDHVRKPKFAGSLANTTKWRLDVKRELNESLSDKSRDYLSNDVMWWKSKNKKRQCVRTWDDLDNGGLFL